MDVVDDDPCHVPLVPCLADLGARTYISEPNRGRRNWKGKAAARDATYENRRRMRRAKGKQLQRRRGEVLERGFALHYPRDGLRRTHVRRHENVLKRLFVHVAAGNLGLVMRQAHGAGTPKGLQGLSAALVVQLKRLRRRLITLTRPMGRPVAWSHRPLDAIPHLVAAQ